MEILKHLHQEDSAKCRRRHIVHCILHVTLQLATLTAAVLALHEIGKVKDSVGRLKRAK
ncbi:MAG: hypothetical protein K2H17_00465 [Duncaniella sp.]|uniref:hypothetical protein n=1 Tax=Duncaniella sp. TaxID=2518496 RepID=UPI0023C3CBD4|nr:hypothetical protein [Duncaniella sp.]MDE5987847.1 hypothetical protein [Duncaniella sp.]